MHVRVINPNTTASMTALIEQSARAVAGPGTRVEAVNPAMGPASIESHYEEALAVPGILAVIAEGERAGVDGYVLACFGDPGWTRRGSWRPGRWWASPRRRCMRRSWWGAVSAW